MSAAGKKWAMFGLRWTIAVAGIGWVISQMSLRDYVTILDENSLPRIVALARPARGENDASFVIVDPLTENERIVARGQIVNEPDQKKAVLAVKVGENATGIEKLPLRALDLDDDLLKVKRLLVERDGKGFWISPGQVVGGYDLRVPHPRVDVGVISMVSRADAGLLWAAMVIFPVVFLITSFRWHALLAALNIRVSQSRAFVITMVGAFYSTFMLGSTGGDVLKAWYASRQTPHRMYAAVSVVVDRAIGLLALILMCGAMATWQYSSRALDPRAAPVLRQVVLATWSLVAALAIAMALLSSRRFRAITGIESLLARLPMQKPIQNALGALHVYKRRPALILWTIAITFPVHIIVVISALFAGKAFGLPLPPQYYFVAVPVIVLAGAVPISPQGAGVMEFFAIQLTRHYGTTVSQAFALTMSIRLVQMLWNLTGGIFVIRGGYHAPTASEKHELAADQEEGPASAPAPAVKGSAVET